MLYPKLTVVEAPPAFTLAPTVADVAVTLLAPLSVTVGSEIGAVHVTTMLLPLAATVYSSAVVPVARVVLSVTPLHVAAAPPAKIVQLCDVPVFVHPLASK